MTKVIAKSHHLFRTMTKVHDNGDIILCKRLIFGRLHLHNDASIIVIMAGWFTVVMRDFVKDSMILIRVGACSFASSINLCISNSHISFGDNPSITDHVLHGLNIGLLSPYEEEE